MSVKDLGKAFETLIQDVSEKTARITIKEMPTQEDLKSLEDRIKNIEATLGHILKKSGGNPLRKSNRGRKPGPVRICAEEGCSRPVVARGLCSMHYQRWRAEQAEE